MNPQQLQVITAKFPPEQIAWCKELMAKQLFNLWSRRVRQPSKEVLYTSFWKALEDEQKVRINLANTLACFDSAVEGRAPYRSEIMTANNLKESTGYFPYGGLLYGDLSAIEDKVTYIGSRAHGSLLIKTELARQKRGAAAQLLYDS